MGMWSELGGMEMLGEASGYRCESRLLDMGSRTHAVFNRLGILISNKLYPNVAINS